METVTIHKAKTELSKLLKRVEAGEEIMIARGNKEIARILGITERTVKAHVGAILEKLNALPFFTLSEEQQLLAARDYQLVLVRLGAPDSARASACTLRLDALYPAKSWRVNHLLCELLAHLKAPGFRDKTVALLATIPSETA